MKKHECKLQIVQPNAETINEAFGISDERRDELQSKMEEAMKEDRISDTLEKASEFCENHNELALCCYEIGRQSVEQEENPLAETATGLAEAE